MGKNKGKGGGKSAAAAASHSQAAQEEESKGDSEGPVYEKNGSLYIVLNVKPNSRTDRVTEIIDGEAIGISVSEPPRDG